MPSLRDPFRDVAADTSVDGLGQLGRKGGFSGFRTTAGTSASVVGARLSAVDPRTFPIVKAASAPTAHGNLLVKLHRAAA